ncbi:MAG: peroxidase-related enzyme [Thermodesulfobacteriota bacterium]
MKNEHYQEQGSLLRPIKVNQAEILTWQLNSQMRHAGLVPASSNILDSRLRGNDGVNVFIRRSNKNEEITDMAFIELPSLDQVDPEVKERFDKIKAATGKLSDVWRILGVRLDIMDMTNHMIKTLLLADTELDAVIKEYIAIIVSIENGCSLCVGEHERISKMMGIPEEKINQLKEGVETADMDDAVKTLLRFCKKSAKEAYKVTQEDFNLLREKGYSDSQLLEAVTIVSFYNFMTTMTNALGA